MNARTLRQLADEWFARAEEDFGAASSALKRHEYPHVLAFTAHQSAERFLKGLLVLHHKDIQDEFKTHDLEKLYGFAVDVEPTLSAGVLKAAKQLDPVYTASRYPEDLPAPFWDEAPKLVAAAAAVRDEVRSLLKKTD